MAEWCNHWNVKIWAYCLMPNHIHLIAVPASEEGLRRAIGETHRRYTRLVNFRENWRGHLWQGRFASYPMDESYLLAATRYIELNPVRAGITERVEAYPWSSALAHINGNDDKPVKVSPLIELVKDWKKFLFEEISVEKTKELRRHERTGRPLGNVSFIEKLEGLSGRLLKRQKPGPKR